MPSNIIEGSTGVILHNWKEATKWFYDDNDYYHELWSYSNVLANIDPEAEFTPQLIRTNYERCPCELIGYFNSSNSLVCPEWNGMANTLTMEYTGASLYEFSGWDGILSGRLNLDRFARALYGLMNGIKRLQMNELVHCDIKPTNLTYNTERNLLKLIDFGWLYPYRKMYEPIQNSYSYLGTHYKYFPPEFKITFVLKTCKKKHLRLPTLVEFKEYYIIPYFKSYGSTRRHYLEYHPFAVDDLVQIYHRAKRNFIKSLGQTIYQGPLDTIDSFGLGLTLMEFMNRMKDKYYTSPECYNCLNNLIMILTQPNPFYRGTMEMSIDLLYRYLVRR